MLDMEIKVVVSDLDLTSVVGEHVVYDDEGDYGREPQTLGQAVAAQVARDLMKDDSYRTLKAQVMELRTEEVRAQLKPIVTAAIEAPVQRTNSYGSPLGEPTPLTELIVKEVHEYLRRRDGYGSDAPTVVQKLIRDEVDRAIKKELAQAIADERAKVVAAVRAKAADLIAQAVKEGVGR